MKNGESTAIKARGASLVNESPYNGGAIIACMYSVFFGTDTVGARQSARAAAATVVADTGALLAVIDGDNYRPGVVADALGSASLFGEPQCYLIDTPSADDTFFTEVVEGLSALKESVHQFFIIEGALLAADKKRYEKHAARMEEVKAAAAERYNTFALADSLAKRDKKTLWVQLQEVRALGIPAEEVIGILWWQVKSLLLAARTSSAAEAGMKDFPYQKAKRALSAFKPGELETLAESLLLVYHDGHGGVRDIDMALERWVLGV